MAKFSFLKITEKHFYRRIFKAVLVLTTALSGPTIPNCFGLAMNYKPAVLKKVLKTPSIKIMIKTLANASKKIKL